MEWVVIYKHTDLNGGVERSLVPLCALLGLGINCANISISIERKKKHERCEIFRILKFKPNIWFEP